MKQHGGKRKGAGRKAPADPRIAVTWTVRRSIVESIRALAKRDRRTIADVLEERLTNKEDETK